MFEILYTILFLRALVFMFSKEATTPKGFGYVMLGIATLMGLMVLGALMAIFDNLKGGSNGIDYTELIKAGIGAIVLGGVAYLQYQAYLILSKTAPQKFEIEQEFQIFQAITRAFNMVFAIVMVFVVINVIMLFVFLIGLFIFLIIVVGTLGLALLSKDMKFNSFVYIPSEFFKAEEAYFKWVGVDAAIIILICGVVIFLIPTALAVWVVIRKQKLLGS